MEPGENCDPSAFDTLFERNVPHILEGIFFSLDYKSFKTCMSVNKTWRVLRTTARYQKELKEMLIEKTKNEEKLYSASEEGEAEEVRRLVHNHAVDVNFEMGQLLTTPLIEAARKGHIEIVQTLLHAGADINRASASQWRHTPLILAVYNNHYEIVKLLLDAGAKVDKTDRGGSTPLWWVESKDVAKILLEHGADPDKADDDGRTPLHGAVLGGRAALIKTLIEGGADPDRKDERGHTPLETARYHGSLQVVDILLEVKGLKN